MEVNNISKTQERTTRRVRRPIEKLSMNYVDNPGTSQDNFTLRTSGAPETFVGGFLIGNIAKGASTSRVNFAVALIIARDGQTVSTLNLTEGQALYKPEQDVLWGTFLVTPKAADSDETILLKEMIKAQRKMKAGDTLRLINLADAANGPQITATFVGFFKQ